METGSDHAEVHAEISWFEGSVDEAFALARAEARPVFLYWGAEWCPPCHYLKNKIFNQPEFVAKMADFVPVYLDGDTERAQIVGEELDVRGYPTVIVFSPDGEEVMRMDSGIPVGQYTDVLEAAVQVMRPVDQVLESAIGGNPANAPRADLNLLAFYSWDQDSKSGLADEDKLATFETLYRWTPDSLSLQRSRFFSLYMKELMDHHQQAGNELAPLSDEDRALYTDDMVRILADRDLRNSNLFPVLYQAQGIIALLQPDSSKKREELIAAWKQAAREVENDTTLSLDDRLTALAPQISLAKLATDESTADGDDEAELPADLLDRVRERVTWAAENVSGEGELQAVMSTMVWLLQSSGLSGEAETLLTERMADTTAPYYFMSWLASVKKDAEEPEEALLWYRKAYDTSRGRYSRFRWGSTYLRRLIEIAPGDSETIEAASLEILGELLEHDDAFAGGNHSRLESLGRAYESWNENGTRDESIDRIGQHVHEACRRYPEGGEDSQRSRCLTFLAG
jgi:thiol-disulfide isomerase/thioredoxin